MASARHFHGRCDGHAPTLTLIQDTEGNIFGGFTPVEWEPRKYDNQATDEPRDQAHQLHPRERGRVLWQVLEAERIDGSICEKPPNRVSNL
jgi:hypothetical protein